VLDVFARGRLVVVTRHHVEPAGQVVLTVDPVSPLVGAIGRDGGSVQVLVRAVLTRAGPSRCRARVELLGRMSCVPGRERCTLVVEPTHVSVDDLAVAVRRYRRAVPVAHEVAGPPPVVDLAAARRQRSAPVPDP